MVLGLTRFSRHLATKPAHLSSGLTTSLKAFLSDDVSTNFGRFKYTGGTPFRHLGQPQSSVVEPSMTESDSLQQKNEFENYPSQPPSFNAPYKRTNVAFNDAPRSFPFPEEMGQDYASETLFARASETPFSNDIASILQTPLNSEEVEIKPDGVIYLPENRYRRLLTRAFGAGGWALVPRGAHVMIAGVLSREYALFCLGRFVSQARGHAAVMSHSTPAMASEVVRSNALMRLCKDLGIANELFDPAYISSWRSTNASRRIENGKIRWIKQSPQLD